MADMPPLPQDLAHWHPAVVHFPIACLVVAAVIEWAAILRRQAGFGPGVPVVLAIGIIGGFAAMLSGFEFEEVVKGGLGEKGLEMLERHELAGIVSTASAFAAFVAGLIYRRGPILGKRIVYLLLLHLSAAAVAYGGALGGSLVWD
jgi:uncharacterized membrane protein